MFDLNTRHTSLFVEPSIPEDKPIPEEKKIEVKGSAPVKLDNYDEIKKDQWAILPTSAYIRYKRKDDDKMRSGGFIQEQGITGDGRQYIMLGTGAGKHRMRWRVYYDDIAQIWRRKGKDTPGDNSTEVKTLLKNIKKPGAKNVLLDMDVKKLQDDVEQLKHTIETLRNSQIQAKKDIMDLTLLIKRMLGVK